MGEALAQGDLNDDDAGDLVIASGVQNDGDDTIVPTVTVLFGGPSLAGDVVVDPQTFGDFVGQVRVLERLELAVVEIFYLRRQEDKALRPNPFPTIAGGVRQSF